MTKREIEESTNPEVAILNSELKNYNAVAALAESEGGKVLADNMLTDIVADIDELAAGYKKMPHIEMIATCADIKNKLDLLRVLKNAQANSDFTRQSLEEALKL